MAPIMPTGDRWYRAACPAVHSRVHPRKRGQPPASPGRRLPRCHPPWSTCSRSAPSSSCSPWRSCTRGPGRGRWSGWWPRPSCSRSGAVDVAGPGSRPGCCFPVVAFLAAILVVAEVCAAEGVFAAVGSIVARAGRGSPRRMLVADLRRRVAGHGDAEPRRDRGAADPGRRVGGDEHDGEPATDGLRVRPAGQLRVAAAAGLQPHQPARAAVAAAPVVRRLRGR